MISSVLSRLGQDRAFEAFEFLILFFVLVSVVTLAVVLIHQWRTRRTARDTNRRLEGVLRLLGRDLFGAEAWDVVEEKISGNGSRLDTFLSVLDRESFEVWAIEAERTGEVDASEIRLLRDRLVQPGEVRRLASAPARISECNPTFGMPVAVHQSGYQTRGTIAEVEDGTFTMWILGDVDQMDDSRQASFVLLSRSGTYQFDADFTKHADGTLVVQRPVRTLRSQRRRFERHAARLSVTMAPFLGEEQPMEALITELSGGGATVTNPEGSFAVGNVLTLSFEAGGRQYTVAARVVRAGTEDGELHVRFEAMKDQERDAIAESVVLPVSPRHAAGS